MIIEIEIIKIIEFCIGMFGTLSVLFSGNKDHIEYFIISYALFTISVIIYMIY